MTQRHASLLILSLVLVWGGPRVARAERHGPVVKAGPVALHRTRAVAVPGGKTMPLGELADLAFRERRVRNAQLTQATRALLAPALTEETFTESAQATTLEVSTKLTIVDPDEFRRSAPSFASYNAGMKDRGDFSVAKLTPEAKRSFDAFKNELKGYPATHPLKAAFKAGGDAGLLDAIAQGKGDVTIRTKVVIPKAGVTLDGKSALVPKSIDGAHDYAQLETKTYKLVPSTKISGAVVERPLPPGETTVAKFLTGFTKHESFEWEERWEFGTRDYFAIGVHAGYALGLRVPLEVTSTMTPLTMTHAGSNDVAGNYEVSVSARPLNANAQFYQDAGLAPSEVLDGKEFVLEASAYASVDLVAGWGTIKIHEKIPGNADFDWGEHFKPPYGDCGTRCGIDIWLPASVSRTQISLLGIVRGSAQIGFNLSGDGKATIDYTSLFGADETDSTLTNQSKTARSHTLNFGGLKEKNLRTSVPALSVGGSKKYGYRLSNPKYSWTIVATPGVKGTISVNARPFFSLEEVIGPFWLNVFAMKLGTLELGTHAGTPNAASMKGGEKTFRLASNVAAKDVPITAPVKPVKRAKSKK